MKNKKVGYALQIGTLCSISYLVVYIARNVLSAVTPQIIAEGAYSIEYIGFISSLYLAAYAVGQLINGLLGDRIKAKYMMCFGLLLAGICNFLFPIVLDSNINTYIVYGMTGFFLSMIYAPMTKVISENTELNHAVRCMLGLTLASYLGSPIAGIIAAVLVWQSVFYTSSVLLVVMAVVCFVCFVHFEKKGIVAYNQYQAQGKTGNGIKVLIENKIIKFTIISILTGVVRTTVVFWMPTYISQYLNFSSEQSAILFSIATAAISMSTFIAVFVYERLNRNMDLTILVVFVASAIFFVLVYVVKTPVLNIILLVAAIMASNCAASMLWSWYCPSLRDTGMVSAATGFLDFVSYGAAAISSVLFANAVSTIGWGNLILIWLALMVCGVIISVPKRTEIKKQIKN